MTEAKINIPNLTGLTAMKMCASEYVRIPALNIDQCGLHRAD